MRRITRDLTNDELARLQESRARVAAELPELVPRDQMRKEAREEATLSGDLPRAIHARELSLSDIAAQIGVTTLQLDEFLTSERTLRSDVLVRLAGVLGFRLQRAS
jgi:hypothetical protein